MLEEALRDPAKNPGEVAQATLSFIRTDLPNGGASAEERFFNLVLLLCVRVFGEMRGKGLVNAFCFERSIMSSPRKRGSRCIGLTGFPLSRE